MNNREYVSNNGTLDDGGFDLDKEREIARERMMARIGKLSNDLLTATAQRNNGGGGPTSMDILSHYSSTNPDPDSDIFRALEQRARDHQYQYPNRATFEAALELYNRQQCVPSMNPSMGYIADKLWVRKEVKGQHRKPCSDCGIDFTRGMDYIQECGQGPYGADKLCVGCMGRRLKKDVGTNLSTIQQALVPLQQAQSGGILGGSFCQMFRQDHYRR